VTVDREEEEQSTLGGSDALVPVAPWVGKYFMILQLFGGKAIIREPATEDAMKREVRVRVQEQTVVNKWFYVN